jgi:predicted MPP superfamily phosphohydrolase
MRIIQNELCDGAERPFTVLQMTDTHLTCTDEQDSEARRQLACDRRRMCPHAEEELAFVRDFVAKTGATLVHTGDLVDFLTPENLRVAEQFAKDTGLCMIAGNHEIHRCPNNVFCERDFTEDLRCQKDILDGVQTHFDNDIRFFCRTICGVNLVGIYDGDYQISAEQLAALREIVAQGRPILLFMHIPLFCEELLSLRRDCMLATPQDIVDTYPLFRQFEQRADEVTRAAWAYIMEQELIKCVISGHVHADFETVDPSSKKQLITGLETLREIHVT